MMTVNDVSSGSKQASKAWQVTTIMARRMINVLAIGDEASGGRSGWQDLAAHGAEAGLLLFRAEGLDEATVRLRDGQIDAILWDRPDAGAIAWIGARADNLPILVIDRESAIDVAGHAIDLGAEDVLLADDLAPHRLRRRIDLAIARKASGRKRLQQARWDELTGLANSALLEERFARALARADRFATLVSLVALELDDLDQLVDDQGEPIAERILPMAAERLQGQIRQTDTLARTREHGFTWMVEGLAALDDINALVDRLPKHLAKPFVIDGREIRLTASIGVAICPLHGQDFQTVHGMAEAAMLDVASISGDGLLMPPPIRSMRSTPLT